MQKDANKKYISMPLYNGKVSVVLQVLSLGKDLGWAFVYCLLAFFISCRKELKPSWDVNILAPLVKTTLTINNIIPDSLIQKNDDNTLALVLQSSLTSFSSSLIFQIPDTTLDTTLWLFPATLSPCSTIIPPTNDATTYNLNDVQLTKAIIRSGKMKLVVTNNIDGNIQFNYKIPIATLNGQPFDTTFIVPKRTSSSSPGIFTAVFDLSGYILDLRGLDGKRFNTLVKNISAKVPCSEPSPINLNWGDYLKVENSFIALIPQYAKGYFGNTVSNIGPDSADFSLFNHIISGSLALQDINIGLSIENSIGADARMTIKNLSSVNTRTQSTVSLSHPIIGTPVNLNRAVDNSVNVISSLYNISFTPSNSNIKQFVENLPNKIRYLLDLEINPLGNVSGNNDFIYYDKLLKTNLNMTIPLSLIANNLTLADTIDFNAGKSLDNVNYGTLYLYAENGFPFTAQAQIYLLNNNSAITDSLISIPNIILAPALDANFIAAGKYSSRLSIPLVQNKMQSLRDAKKIYLKIKFNTAGQPNYVKIYSFYQMDVQLVGDFNYTVKK
jgi:hypothetical protein